MYNYIACYTLAARLISPFYVMFLLGIKLQCINIEFFVYFKKKNLQHFVRGWHELSTLALIKDILMLYLAADPGLVVDIYYDSAQFANVQCVYLMLS